MESYRLAIIAAVFALLFSSAISASTTVAEPAARNDGAQFILARLGLGLRAAKRPPGFSTPLQPVAQSCKDKCEDDRDKCFNACPSEPNEAAVCRDGCTDVYDTCQKAC